MNTHMRTKTFAVRLLRLDRNLNCKIIFTEFFLINIATKVGKHELFIFVQVFVRNIRHVLILKTTNRRCISN